ncbi:FtsX-like permease family protein [Falsiroseomonas ponticola]|uniref:FtsX-like permease family protein n=1 Tax=Falsiroseomonas ponticola TaxID=2786951 RepID=UPI0019317925|nr:FtsX-like permease family protein [Roseomonas ponticola]
MALARFAVLLALRQLRHRALASLAALAGVAVAVMLMLVQVGFRNGLYDSALALPRALAADLVLVSPGYRALTFSPPWFPRAALRDAAGVPGVAEAAILYAYSGQIRSPETGGNLSAWLLGIDPAARVLDLPAVVAAQRALSVPDTALIDRLSRQEFGAVIAQVAQDGLARLPVYAPAADLAPVLSVRGLFTLGPSFTIDGTLLMSDLTLHATLGVPLDRVSIGLLRLEPGAGAQAMAAAIAARIEGRARVLTRADYLAEERHFYASRTPIGVIFNVGLLVGIAVGIVFILQVLNGLVDANLPEYAVLLAQGYPPAFLAAVVAQAAIAIALVTWLPALALALAVTGVAAEVTRLPIGVHGADMAMVLGLSLAMAAVAAGLATLRLRRADPLELFG